MAYRLGKKRDTQGPDKRDIIVKLCRRELKHDIIRACKSSKHDGLFINESLTPVRSFIQYGLRVARRKFPDKIVSLGSHEGKVYCWVKHDRAGDRNSKMFINSVAKFNELCENVLCCGASELVSRWPSY